MEGGERKIQLLAASRPHSQEKNPEEPNHPTQRDPKGDKPLKKTARKLRNVGIHQKERDQKKKNGGGK